MATDIGVLDSVGGRKIPEAFDGSEHKAFCEPQCDKCHHDENREGHHHGWNDKLATEEVKPRVWIYLTKKRAKHNRDGTKNER